MNDAQLERVAWIILLRHAARAAHHATPRDMWADGDESPALDAAMDRAFGVIRP
jgi:hypothetical protein